jgi:hypothetical protein
MYLDKTETHRRVYFQLPTEDWPDFESQVKVEKDECLRSEFSVRFNYFSMSEKRKKSGLKLEELGSELVHRKQAGEKR